MDECEEMIDVVRASRALNKSKWGRQDKWAFHILKQYGGDGSRNMRTMPARLELVEAMVNRMRATRWMTAPRIDTVMEALSAEQRMGAFTIDMDARALMCRCDTYYHDGRLGLAMEACEEGLRLEPQLGAVGKKHGTMPMLLYLRAAMLVERNEAGDLDGARASLKRIPGYGKGYWLHPPVMFKSSVLNKDIAANH